MALDTFYVTYSPKAAAVVRKSYIDMDLVMFSDLNTVATLPEMFLFLGAASVGSFNSLSTSLLTAIRSFIEYINALLKAQPYVWLIINIL